MNERSIFLEALEKQNAAERASYLDGACAGDAALRQRVEALLQSHDQAPDFLGKLAPQLLVEALAVPQIAGETQVDRLAADTGDHHLDFLEPADKPGLLGRLGHYEVNELIGRSGMSIVFKGFDEKLNRVVAIKVMNPELAASAVARKRFAREAQAAAAVCHDHVVDIHAVEEHHELPCIIMQYVAGGSLRDRLRAGGLLPAREVARIGIEAAAGLAAAHAVGLIHRDVKPANILQEKETGRIRITDFGLARAVTDGSLSQAGVIAGTPQYMSPEQARGQPLDHRTDIYSLGVTLYELATGKPAIAAGSTPEVLRRVETEESLPPRQLNRAIPVDLETVILKAIAKDANDRYATVQELGDDLQRFLKDEPIRAKRPGWVQRTRKWARRRRPVVATASVGLFLALAVLAGSIGWVVRDQAARQLVVEEIVKQALAEADVWQVKEKWPEALAAVKRAEAALAGGGSEELRGPVQNRRNLLEMVSRLEDIRIQVMSEITDEYRFDFKKADGAYGEVFIKYGIDVESLTDAETAQRLRERGLAVQVAAALDNWAMVRREAVKDDASWKQLLAVARVVDPDDWRNRLRDCREEANPQALSKLATSEAIATLPAPTLLLLGDNLEEAGLITEAERVLRKAQQGHPNDLWINFELAVCCADKRLSPRRLDEAVRFYTVVIALKPGMVVAWSNRAIAYEHLNQLDLAIADFSKAIELKPGIAVAWNNRGIAYAKLKQFDRAIADYSKAVGLKPDLAPAWYNRGVAYANLKQFDRAIADYSKSIELKAVWAEAWYNRGVACAALQQFDRAIADYSKAIDQKPDWAEAWSNRGVAYANLMQFDRAIAEFSKAIALKPVDAQVWNNRGSAYENLKQFDRAIADFSEAIQLKPDYTSAWYNRGIAYAELKQFDRAIADYSKAIQLKPDYASAWYNRGIAYAELKQFDRAIADYSKAIQLKPDHAGFWINRATSYVKLKQFDRAIADHSKAIELNPGLAIGWYNRGNVRKDLKQFDRAIADFSKAIEVQPDHAGAWINRGSAYANLKQFEQAIADFSQAIHLRPDSAVAWINRGSAYADLKQFERAITDFSKSIELKANDASAWYIRGIAYANLKQFDRAITDYSKAIVLKPDWAEAWTNRGAACVNAKQLDRAISDFSKAIALKPVDAQAWYNRGVAYAKLKQFDRAIADYSKAIELNANNAGRSDAFAWLLTTCPDSRLRDPKRALELAKSAVELAPRDGSYSQTLGVACYRAGDHRAAIEAIDKSMKLRKGGDSVDWFFLAMAHWQLGKKEEARKWYEKAVAWMDKNQPNNEELRRFRAEAEELLKKEPGVRNQKSDKKQPPDNF